VDDPRISSGQLLAKLGNQMVCINIEGQ
jgi:hypothetical protein